MGKERISLDVAKLSSLPGGRMAGLSLVELMVALVIGLIGSLAITQVFTNSEAGRRAVGGGSDAQTNGAIGVYAIERDLQQAGLGFTNPAALGCQLRTNGALPVINNLPLLPAAIIPAGVAAGDDDNQWGIPPGDPDSDMIIVSYGDPGVMIQGSMFSGKSNSNPFKINSAQSLSNHTQTYVLLAQVGKECTLSRLVSADTNGINIEYSIPEDYDGGQAVAFNLGRQPRLLVYAVRAGRLTVCNFVTHNCSGGVGDDSVWVPVVGDVAALVAQHGWDTRATKDIDANLVVDTFCKRRLGGGEACPGGETGLPSAGNRALTQQQRACDSVRTPVIRFALVTRSSQAERNDVSPATITLWPDSAVSPTTTGPVFTVPDRTFRYRVVTSTVPLRNMVWMKGALC